MPKISKRQKANKYRANGRFNNRANKQSRMNSLQSHRGGTRL